MVGRGECRLFGFVDIGEVGGLGYSVRFFVIFVVVLIRLIIIIVGFLMVLLFIIELLFLVGV